MCSAVKLPVLCALMLTFFTTHCQNIQDINSNQATPQCDTRTPEIRIISIDYDALEDIHISANENKAIVEYGRQTSLEITCSGENATALVMRKDGVKLQTRNERETDVVWRTKKIDLQQSEYVCTDTETNCQFTAIVAVIPKCPFMLPNSEHFGHGHILQYGNSITFSCYGSPASRLSISKHGQKLPARNLSDTAIKWFDSKPDVQASKYVCTDVETGNSCSSHVRVVPLMYIKSGGTLLEKNSVEYDTGTFIYHVQYNDDIEVFCSGPRPVTLISRLEENKDILARNVSKNTVKAFVRNYINGLAVFSCIDSENSEHISTVQIIPVLNMVGNSKSFHPVGYTGSYAVQYGEPLEIVCAGFDADHITVSENGVTTEKNLYAVNKTAIKWIVDKPEIRFDGEDSEYICSTGIYQWSLNVAVVPLIEAAGFRCVAHYKQYLNCSWTVLNNNNKYDNRINLFYIQEGTPVRTWPKVNIYTPTLSWVWHDTDYPSYNRFGPVTLTFMIQSCNFIGCSNQTIIVDHCSTFKPHPPEGLRVDSKSPYGAVLHWQAVHYMCPYKSNHSDDTSYGDMIYKLQYGYSGTQPLAVNLSQIDTFNQYELKLPCPDGFYQVWLYQKLNGTIGEDYWSEPSSISFFTAADTNITGAVDPACDPKPKKTKEVMTYFVQELEQYLRLVGRQIKAKALLLREKLAKIQAYRDNINRR